MMQRQMREGSPHWLAVLYQCQHASSLQEQCMQPPVLSFMRQGKQGLCELGNC